MLAALAPYASESDNDDDSDNSVNHNSDNNDSVNDDGAFDDEDNSKNNLMNVEFDRKRSCTENGDPSKRRRMQDVAFFFGNYQNYIENDYPEFVRKKMIEYKEYIRRFPPFYKMNNQDIGRKYYERLACIVTNSILFSDQPETFYEHHNVNKKDMGVDSIDLARLIAYQMKFFLNSLITYSHLRQTIASASPSVAARL